MTERIYNEWNGEMYSGDTEFTKPDEWYRVQSTIGFRKRKGIVVGYCTHIGSKDNPNKSEEYVPVIWDGDSSPSYIHRDKINRI